MTKSKSQLRAEAVERLKNYDKRKHKNLARCVLGDRYEDVSFEANRLMLIDLLTDDAHESRGSYEERLDVPVSDCPYCGCKRVVIHDFSDIYENPHSYRVEHVDEKEAFEAGCFETYYAFDSVGKAVEHANMRDTLTDEPTNGIEGETNGIHADAPLVDEPPESDAITHARWRWKYRPEDGDEVVMSEYNCNLLMSDLDAIADMVERDYVSREAYDDLRDEFVWTSTFLHRMGKKCGTKDVPSLVAYVDKLEARVEELEAIDRRIAETDSRWEAAIRDLERMTAERDELQERVDNLCASEEIGNKLIMAQLETDAEQNRTIIEYAERVDMLEAERDVLQRQLDTIRDMLTNNETCPNSDGTCPDADRTPSIEQGDDGVAKLDAQARAEIEDAERSRAVSGDAAAEVDSDTGGTEKTPQEPRECGRITFTDTREMLEADVRTYMFPWRVDMALDWLDRQAAITERHWMEICGANANANVELKRQIDVLEANNAQPHALIAELQAERDKLEAELNRTCTLAYDGKWLICSNCGESLQWFGVRTIYKECTQERALGVEGVRFCPFCGARIEGGDGE